MTNPSSKEVEPAACPWCAAVPVKTDLAPSQRYRLDHKPTCYLYGRMTDMRGSSKYIFIRLSDVEKWNTRVSADSAASKVEEAWLIEKMHNGNVHYISANYVLEWTDDPNKALRLARREDAEALCTIVEDADKIASHEWVPAPPAPLVSDCDPDG